MHGLLASSYQLYGGASCRIHTDHPLHVTVTELATDGRTRFTDRLVPVGDHVVRSAVQAGRVRVRQRQGPGRSVRRRQAQRTTPQRGYGYAHQKARRAALATHVDGDPCSRCGGPMYHGQPLDLDHNDDRTGYLGLAHRRCNQLAGASKGGRVTARQRHGGTPQGSYALRVAP